MSGAFSQAQMLIRKPAAVLFNAFIDPAVTTQFWFTKSSGKLAVDETVTWEWEMYGASTTAKATEIVPDEKIVFEWGSPARQVELLFEKRSDEATYVTATETGYTETGDALLAIIRDSTGGFTTVLDALKALAEHGLPLNLVADKFANQ